MLVSTGVGGSAGLPQILGSLLRPSMLAVVLVLVVVVMVLVVEVVVVGHDCHVTSCTVPLVVVVISVALAPAPFFLLLCQQRMQRLLVLLRLCRLSGCLLAGLASLYPGTRSGP